MSIPKAEPVAAATTHNGSPDPAVPPARHSDPLNDPAELARLRNRVGELIEHALHYELKHAASLEAMPERHRSSARNLLHYIALRQHDLTELQGSLNEIGLSSLGRLEPYTLATLIKVHTVLAKLHSGRAVAPQFTPQGVPTGFHQAKLLLQRHSAAVLGPRPRDHKLRVMVTMPSEAAYDYALVRDLVAAGMNVMRVNCAHDDAAAWKRMAEHLRRAERELGAQCRILCDLGGPKIRTGALEATPGQIRWKSPRPEHAEKSTRKSDAELLLSDGSVTTQSAAAVIPVPAEFLAQVEVGDRIVCTNPDGASEKFRVTRIVDGGVWIRAPRKGVVYDRAELLLRRKKQSVAGAVIGPLAPTPLPISLQSGDRLILTRDPLPGRNAVHQEDGTVIPARVSCTLPEILAVVKPGERVMFDDGKIAGIVLAAQSDSLTIEITFPVMKPAKLRAEKGINFPDSSLPMSGIADKDLEDLVNVASFADIIGLSFVRSSADIETLMDALTAMNRNDTAIVLKIENRAAFQALPRLIFTALRWNAVGVMIARGDLGVELGFERLAEVQEEITWLCSAAHVPVIWATQVLESLVKTGVPTRGEMTDAAEGVGLAECVMLNKGPHVVEGVKCLTDLAIRFDRHQSKKFPKMSPLNVALQADSLLTAAWSEPEPEA